MSYCTSKFFAQESLDYGVTLYARVRHYHNSYGWSAYSNTVSFSIQTPARIVGVCMDNSNASAKGTFTYIDANGNTGNTTYYPAKYGADWWKQHPIYKNITKVEQDGVTLACFPLFYVKTAASGPINTASNGKKCWWISDIAVNGFRPAACFKRGPSSTSVASSCCMGTYLGHAEKIRGKDCIGSAYNKTVLASQTKATFKTRITNRNDSASGVSGFRMFDIWDLGALRLLLLIAKCNSDTQTAWGDNSAGTPSPKTGSTNAKAEFPGGGSMQDLWRCYWYHADLITVTSGVVSLQAPYDLSSAISFGSAAQTRYKQPTTSGWIRDVLDCPFMIGNDYHDLMELFLPSQVVSAENLGTFSDYHWIYYQESVLVTGGLPYAAFQGKADAKGYGFFISRITSSTETGTYNGSSIDKILSYL